ncbi:hypothetical protein LUB17_01355 [Enterococcus lactis]|nr:MULTISPECIES: hypothetical protein [Enterococcus]EGP5692126.1 hypothetical protein [Enterococcus faecium]MCD9221563.1 hypothetical protein [Enterococcus lactis]OTO89179.1 hypothetical protein A5849_001089 [Enterococcus sp. 10F3_DIV0382]
MTINDKHYNDISEKVYWLDPKYPRYNEGYKKNSVKEFAGMEFQILQIKDSLDGMQAMAVAPIVHSKLEKNFKNKKFLQTFAYLNNKGINTYIKRKEARSCPGK